MQSPHSIVQEELGDNLRRRDSIMLIAERRSGTQYLTSILSTHPRIAGYGEIFKGTYWLWREQHVLLNPPLITPTAQANIQLFLRYINGLVRMLEKPSVLFNVKYNHLHALDAANRRHGEEPLLFSVAKARRMPVIHLVRENLLETVVSLYRYKATGVAQTTYAEPTVTLQVKPARALADLRRLTADIDFVDRSFASYGKMRRISYHDAVNSLDETLASLSTFLGVKNTFETETRLRKISRPLPEQVENWGELSAVLRDEGFGHLVDMTLESARSASAELQPVASG